MQDGQPLLHNVQALICIGTSTEVDPARPTYSIENCMKKKKLKGNMQTLIDHIMFLGHLPSPIYTYSCTDMSKNVSRKPSHGDKWTRECNRSSSPSLRDTRCDAPRGARLYFEFWQAAFSDVDIILSFWHAAEPILHGRPEGGVLGRQHLLAGSRLCVPNKPLHQHFLRKLLTCTNPLHQTEWGCRLIGDHSDSMLFIFGKPALFPSLALG